MPGNQLMPPASTGLSRKPSKFVRRSMDRIRRSFRDSFRRRSSKDRGGTGDSKPQQWQQDEAAVRAGTCNFFVKYLGSVEVFESRGMQVCEEALKVLRAQRRRPMKSVLYVSGDGLRVVDQDNKGLLVDQTIEKVSFCAPDRSHEKGFAYICRDGSSRRWVCHGFHATKESGERLSHAVGCAFAVCLEKKQKRDREGSLHAFTATSITQAAANATPQPETASTNENNGGNTNFGRMGSFRQATLVERKTDPQNVKPADPPPPPSKPAEPLPSAVARPHANPQLFERQGSLRMPADSSAFRRHHSLRIGELPSTLARQSQLGMPGARVSSIPEEDSSPSCPPQHPLPLTGSLSTASFSPPSVTNSQSETASPFMTASAPGGATSAPPTGRGKLVHADTIAVPPSAGGNWDLSFAENFGYSSPKGGDPNNASARSRADEWLEQTLMKTAGQGGSRGPTPPTTNGYSGPSPPPHSPSHPPIPTPGLHQPTLNQGTPVSPPQGSGTQQHSQAHPPISLGPRTQSTSSQSPRNNSSPLNQQPNNISQQQQQYSNSPAHLQQPMRELDEFGQPIFNPSPARNPPIGQLRSLSVTDSPGRDGGVRNLNTSFEDRWAALQRKPQSTNPFSTQSDAVDI